MDATSKWWVTGSPGTAVGGKQSNQGTDDQMKREDCGRNGMSELIKQPLLQLGRGARIFDMGR